MGDPRHVGSMDTGQVKCDTLLHNCLPLEPNPRPELPGGALEASDRCPSCAALVLMMKNDMKSSNEALFWCD